MQPSLQLKTKGITYSECEFVALRMQHATRMRRIILSLLTCPALLYFSTLSHERHDYIYIYIFETKCVYWLSSQLVSETILILRRSKWYKIKSVHCSSWRIPIIHVRLLWNEISRQIFEKFWKITCHENPSSWSGRTDWQADRQDGANSRFPQFR